MEEKCGRAKMITLYCKAAFPLKRLNDLQEPIQWQTGPAAKSVYVKVTLLMYMIDFQFCRAAIATQRVAHPNLSMERQPKEILKSGFNPYQLSVSKLNFAILYSNGPAIRHGLSDIRHIEVSYGR